MQMLISLNEVCDMYGHPNDGGRQHVASGNLLGIQPSKDLRLQMGKLIEGMKTNKYVEQCHELTKDLKRRDQLLQKELTMTAEDGGNETKLDAASDEETYVTPTSLRTLVGEGHPEFSTGRQQDAGEFLEYVINLVEKQAREVYSTPSIDISRLFTFDTVSRTDAGSSIGVKYETTRGNKVLRLPIPVHMISNQKEYDEYLAAAAEEEAQGKQESPQENKSNQAKKRKVESTASKIPVVLPNVNFEDVLHNYKREDIFDFRSGTAKRTAHLGNFPQYLWVQLNRYTYDDAYQPVKLKHTGNALLFFCCCLSIFFNISFSLLSFFNQTYI
jgi:uncharacterized UBP type Zn finger protein